MKRDTPSGMGPKCAQSMLGERPKRQRAAAPKDERQADLFGEVRA